MTHAPEAMADDGRISSPLTILGVAEIRRGVVVALQLPDDARHASDSFEENGAMRAGEPSGRCAWRRQWVVRPPFLERSRGLHHDGQLRVAQRDRTMMAAIPV
jgi:hypothetical protein